MMKTPENRALISKIKERHDITQSKKDGAVKTIIRLSESPVEINKMQLFSERNLGLKFG